MDDDQLKREKRRYFPGFKFLAGFILGLLSGLFLTLSLLMPGVLELNNRHHTREVRATRHQSSHCPQQPAWTQIRTIDEWRSHCEEILQKPQAFTPLPPKQ